MPFPVTKTTTITANGYIRGGLTFNLADNGTAIQLYHPYQFIDADGVPVAGVQNFDAVDEKHLLSAIPADLLAALTTIWNYADGRIKSQEGL